jgi:predicted CXXCH cytochrome family protein
MEALLRELHQGPDGIPEYRDTEISGAELTIGSAADQRIQLLGRAVAPKHAVIRKSGSKLELNCRSGQRVRVNGDERSSAKLELGDVIELAGHQLTIAEPPGGFDLAIELRPNENIDASEFESAFLTDLNQTWLSKRPAAWLLVAIVLIVGVVLPVSVIVMHRAQQQVPAWLPGDDFWNSGPLSPAHQQAAGVRCDTCHEQPFVRVTDETCQSCHKTIHDHVAPEHLAQTQLGPTQRCATCHREHNEPASFLVNSSDSMCVSCHENSRQHFAQLQVEPVSGFSAEHHPQFKALLLKPTAVESGSGFEFEWKSEIAALDQAVEQSNMKFSHSQHLDPDRVLRGSDSQALNCADCHRLEPDGEHFEPITMENRCADCHELTFDPGAPDRQLPHGKPREVVLTLQDYFTRKFSDPNAGRPTRERRRLPGHEEEEQTCSGAPFDCAMRSAHAEIENQFTRRGCVGCHVVVDTKSESDYDRFQVYPIRFARDYFPAGRFDHRSHQIQGKLTGDAACLSCHKAKESQDSKDLMLPAMAKCEECHGDRPAVEKVTVQCVSCHSYHPPAEDSLAKIAETAKGREFPL